MKELTEDDRYADSDLTAGECAGMALLVALLAVVLSVVALGTAIWGLVR